MRKPTLALPLAALALSTAVRAGHEFPVYPGYYPHEIRIETVAPQEAGRKLGEAKIHAYIGADPRFDGKPPESVRAIESLGSLVLIRVNPESPRAADRASACALTQTLLHALALRKTELVFHPYPVTPFNGDYLQYADLADAAKARALQAPPRAVASPRVRAEGAAAQGLVRPDWRARGAAWDAAVEEVSAADVAASATRAMNGWITPPQARTGWLQATLLLAETSDDAGARARADAARNRLLAADYRGAAQRIDLERELVTAVTDTCRVRVAGYTLKREWINVEYSAGIENIGFDAIHGLESPLFIRTVKLKDFPWNGWLALGTASRPTAAWNPVAGFTDGFGRLAWSALADPALLAVPNNAIWMLNRASDVRPGPSP
jgi:hypothetical protein